MRDFTSIALRALACLVLVGFLGLALLPTRVTRTVIAQDNSGIRPEIPIIPPGSAYRQTNLLSDLPGFAPVLDPLLVNPWGISATAAARFGWRTMGPARRNSYEGTFPPELR
jgi:hypothetical protein